ncbi:MAG: single-stranded-DNA-specific exonuclease RecJ [Hyphomicrobiales bacterium]|nr:single-stranded-DNA-specific exonuclease RecJ [Hyphomicrobiales bacterium]
MTQRHGHPDLLARVMAGRGVSLEAAERWLDPALRDLMPDPSTLRDMDAAVDRLKHAIERGEQIAIFGDYDVDGACSAALLAEFLDACAAPRRIHIPDRIFEGYGPNIPAIEQLADEGATLLVTVDCGTTSHEALAAARRRGLDVIVLDHHQAPAQLPDALVVNPNRQDDLSGQGALCAAGVVFLTLVGLNRALRQAGFWTKERPAPDLLAGLDLVALATVADVAPLVGLNRAFVAKGLQVMRGRRRAGLAALIDVARLSGPAQAWHLGFLIGPRINAGGRIGDAALGARLMLTGDPAQAAAVAADLDRLNGERRAIEQATVAAGEAEAMAALGREGASAAIVVGGQDWHPGVVGLVAARLKEKFRKPAFAIAFNGETGVGSARSIPGVDLGAAVRAAVEAGLLVKGGGHAMAAGVTIERARLGAFRAFLEERLAGAVAAATAADALRIDGALTAAGATAEIVHMLHKAGPFGQGHPEPVFVLPRHRFTGALVMGQDHLRIGAQAADGSRIDLLAFKHRESEIGRALEGQNGARAHFAVALSLDHYGGRERVQARLIDMAFDRDY